MKNLQLQQSIDFQNMKGLTPKIPDYKKNYKELCAHNMTFQILFCNKMGFFFFFPGTTFPMGTFEL